MNNSLITNILNLKMTGLPIQFTSLQQEGCAKSLIDDLRSLLNIDSLLQHTRLEHNFQIQADEKRHPHLNLVLGLTLKVQTELDYSFRRFTLGALELQVLEDRHRLINACKSLPIQSSAVVSAVANRISAACLDLPLVDLRPEIKNRLRALLRVRQKNWSGSVAGSPFDHQKEMFPKYEWHRDIYVVRVLLLRATSGYTLKFLVNPPFLRPSRRIAMPRPKDLATTEALERAQFLQDPIDIAIRVGSKLGSDAIAVADFVSFSP
jgi:hypothetical protein